MKLKHYILPLALAVCANTAMSEDYGWYHHPQAMVGPFSSPLALCNSLGNARILDMNHYPLITWGSTGLGRCEDAGGTVFFRSGDSCPAGKVYDNKQMSCEPPESKSKKEECTGGIKDIDGQCNPQADPNSCPEIAGNPVFIATGQKVETVTDLDIPNSALSFTRNYWSSRLDTDTTGLAWQHNWQMHIKELQSRDRIKLYRDNGRGIIFTLRNGRWESDSKDTEVITKLANNQGWKVQTATGEIELYNKLGQLISYEKQGVPAVTLTYNTNQQLISLKDTKGRSLLLTYNTKNLVTIVTAGNGSTINYNYDTQNRLISFTKDGNTQKYHYENTKHPQLLTGITDERGVRYATWTYNDDGLAISSEHANGADKYTFEYLPNNQTRVTNPLGKSALYTFQDIRLEKKIKKIEGQAINSCIATNRSFNYNASGLVVSENTKNNATVYYEYDDRGLQTKRRFDGSVLRYESTTKWHDTLPLPIETNNNGQRQSFQYDNNGRLTEYTDGLKDQGQAEANTGKDIVLLRLDNLTDLAGSEWQAKGNVVFDTLNPKIGNSSLRLDGNNSWIETAGKDDYVLDREDFTIEAWVKLTSTAGYNRIIIDCFSNSSYSWQLLIKNTGNPEFKFYGGALTSNRQIIDGNWHHIAVTRKGIDFTLYIDKQPAAGMVKNYVFDYKIPILAIGAQVASRNKSCDFIGNIDQVRITKGKARNPSDFIDKPYQLETNPTKNKNE